MRIIFGVIALLVMVLVACKTENKKPLGYKLTGELNNAPDSSLVVISNLKFADSTIALNGKFSFAGSVHAPQRAVFSLDSKYRTVFWLENAQISVNGNYTNIKDVHFEGGENQKYFNMLQQQKEPILLRLGYLKSQIMRNPQKITKKDSLIHLSDSLGSLLVDIEKEFIRDYPNNLESVVRLGARRRSLGKDSIRALFSMMDSATQNSEPGKEIAHFLELPDPLKVGDVYMDFEQINADGDLVQLSEFLGTYTLIDFWASWCAPCREENPNLVKLYNTYHEHGFNIIGVSQDSRKEAWLRAIKEDQLPWENLNESSGPFGDISMVYDIKFLPDNILLDKNGVIIARNLRGDLLKDKLEQLFHF